MVRLSAARPLAAKRPESPPNNLCRHGAQRRGKGPGVTDFLALPRPTTSARRRAEWVKSLVWCTSGDLSWLLFRL